MKQSEAKDFLPMIQAFAEGKTIQAKNGDRWADLMDPYFSRPVADYRIKPEPRTFYAVEWSDFPVPSIADDLEDAKRVMSKHTTAVRLLTLREVLDE